MPRKYINFAQADNDIQEAAIVEQETSNAASWIDNNTTEAEIAHWNHGKTISVNDKSEGEFRKAVLQYLHDRGELRNEAAVVIAHDQDLWGYGSTAGLSPPEFDGNRYWGCLVYAGGTWIPDWETKIMTWHEIGHALKADHSDGYYTTFTDEYGNKILDDIHPLGTSYTYDSGGHVDTDYEGNNSQIPDTFDDGNLQNNVHTHHGHHKQHHVWDRYSDASLKQMNYYLRYTGLPE